MQQIAGIITPHLKVAVVYEISSLYHIIAHDLYDDLFWAAGQYNQVKCIII